MDENGGNEDDEEMLDEDEIKERNKYMLRELQEKFELEEQQNYKKLNNSL